MDIYDIMRELAEYLRLSDEISATVDGLKDQLKAIMTAQGVDTLTGTEHKASYKAVSSMRLDGAALKRDLPDIAARYSKTIESKRFLFS